MNDITDEFYDKYVVIVPIDEDITINKRKDSFTARICEIDRNLRTVTVEDKAGLTWIYDWNSVFEVCQDNSNVNFDTDNSNSDLETIE